MEYDKMKTVSGIQRRMMMDQNKRSAAMESMNYADYIDAIEYQAWSEIHHQGIRPVRKDLPEKAELKNGAPDTGIQH